MRPVLGFLLAATLLRAQEQQDARTLRDLPVPMRDGIKLATDVHLPAGEGKYPVILCRTPYDKNGEKANAAYFTKHGYAYVAQDTRGRYASEGVWRFLTDDGRDGEECVRWITQQSWSNGKVATIGTSYVGGTQHALALRRPEALVTAIPVDACANLGRQGLRNGGAFELRFWNWIMMNAGKGSRAGRDPETKQQLQEMSEQRKTYLANPPLRKGTTPLQLAPEYETWLVEAMKHGVNDNFWAAVNVAESAARYKDMPLLLIGGWYDSWAGNSTANYTALTAAIKGPVHLVMGPWIHGQQSKHAHGQVDFGADAAIADPLELRRAWYDRWMKGVEGPPLAPVRIFTMGGGDGRKTADGKLFHGGRWRDETAWPPAAAKPTPYYILKDGSLSIPAPTSERNQTSWVFDPKNPVPTIGGSISSGDGLMLQGAWDQRGGPHVWNMPEPIPLSARNDVAVWRTAPLAADVEVTGEIEVKLWASSTATDTDFTAKLVDVYPPSPEFPGGFDLNITDGIVRARFRDSLGEETLMEPNHVYAMTIRLYPTSNLFKKGHRIRLDLSSSNYPRFDINPNSGEPLNDHRRTVVATNTVHHDRFHPSHIVLPVVPK